MKNRERCLSRRDISPTEFESITEIKSFVRPIKGPSPFIRKPCLYSSIVQKKRSDEKQKRLGTQSLEQKRQEYERIQEERFEAQLIQNSKKRRIEAELLENQLELGDTSDPVEVIQSSIQKWGNDLDLNELLNHGKCLDKSEFFVGYSQIAAEEDLEKLYQNIKNISQPCVYRVNYFRKVYGIRDFEPGTHEVICTLHVHQEIVVVEIATFGSRIIGKINEPVVGWTTLQNMKLNIVYLEFVRCAKEAVCSPMSDFVRNRLPREGVILSPHEISNSCEIHSSPPNTIRVSKLSSNITSTNNMVKPIAAAA